LGNLSFHVVFRLVRISWLLQEVSMSLDTTPESVGVSSNRLRDIDTAMQGFVDQGKIAGIATLIARRNKIVHLGCFGKLDLATNRPIQPDSLFRLYSLTKPITSVAALMLHDDGCFQLDDPISTWLPEFSRFTVLPDSTSAHGGMQPLETEMSFRHLLTHTAGLGYGKDREPTKLIEQLYRDANLMTPLLTLQAPLPEIARKVAQLPLLAQPGTGWFYSLAHDVLGYLIELVSGKPFATFLHERLFGPLGMNDTSFFVPHDKLARFGPLYSSSEEQTLAVVDDVPTSPFVRPDVVPGGGAGLVSSLPDVFRFMLMLANGGTVDGVRVLKPDTVAAMTTNQLTGATSPGRFEEPWWPGMGYGLGIGVDTADVPRVGWIGMSGTSAWIYPREEMIVIALPQALSDWEASDTLINIAREAIVSG
jgi:CubicO group peptidase (beta-lactamase class C family)